jgi:hypothetical protein
MIFNMDLNNSRHYYNETNKRMDCSNSKKIQTVSKVRLFVLKAAKVLHRYGHDFQERYFTQLCFKMLVVRPPPPDPPPPPT